jgi:hypothetical protein
VENEQSVLQFQDMNAQIYSMADRLAAVVNHRSTSSIRARRSPWEHARRSFPPTRPRHGCTLIRPADNHSRIQSPNANILPR